MWFLELQVIKIKNCKLISGNNNLLHNSMTYKWKNDSIVNKNVIISRLGNGIFQGAIGG